MNTENDAVVGKMRERTKRVWIADGLQRQHLANSEISVPIRFGLQGALVGDWRVKSRLANLEDDRPLPVESDIIDLFHEAELNRMLIVGEPGSGKSTQLLKIAEGAMGESATGEPDRCPVVLLISTWRRRNQTFLDWLVDEVERTYTVDPKTCMRLLEAGRLILLLDGLDELPRDSSNPQSLEASIGPRIESLNEFLRQGEFVGTGVVITCRTLVYQTFGIRLRLNSGLIVRPLEPDDVRSFLLELDDGLRVLASNIDNDPALRELFTTPLMVVLGALAFIDSDVHVVIPYGDQDAARERIFELYEAKMLERQRPLVEIEAGIVGAAEHSFEISETHRFLVHIARLMERKQATVLFSDELTPEWLPELGEEMYLAPNQPSGAFGKLTRRVGLDHASTGSVGGVLATVFGATFISPVVLYAFPTVPGILTSIILSVALGFAVFSMFGLARMQPFGLSVAAVLDSDQSVARAATQWNWVATRSVRWLPVAALLASIAGVVVYLGKGLSPAIVCATTLVSGSIIGCGMVPNYDRSPDYPGEALAISGRVVRILLMVTSAVGLAITLIVLLAGGPWGASLSAVLLSASLSMVTGPGRAWLRTRALSYGGERSGLFPSHLREFLDHANERVLLRRSGGGYAYLHDYIQKYFASADPDNAPRLTRLSR